MIFDWLLRRPREHHADELRDKTHDAINELQASILDYQIANKQNNQKIVAILTESDKELSSIARKIATATGAGRRGYKP